MFATKNITLVALQLKNTWILPAILQKNGHFRFGILARNFVQIISNYSNMTLWDKILHKDLNAVFEVLQPEAEKNSAVKELLDIYKNTVENSKVVSGNEMKRKHPLIILEGLDGSGKSTMSKQLTKRIRGVQWQTPPRSIKHLREYFDKNVTLRSAYYQLGNYIAALEVSCCLCDSPVVMDRYWHSTAAYAIAQAVADDPETYKMPKKGDQIYSWPKDLSKPDIVLFLSVDEEQRLQRHSRRMEVTNQEVLLKNSKGFRSNVVEAYRNMVDPSVQSIDTNRSYMSTVYALLDKVKPLL